MSALPRPDLPPGPHRDLVEALHDLHHRAGWPSLRTLARETGVSHTTVSHVFSSTRLRSWGVVELIVEAMAGDTTTFRDLWLAASSATGSASPPQIAGRHRELVAVRHHLETGTGLLLVTGEAGMGKTKLVTTAAALAATDVFVATGSCLPLSSEAPLMPVADALRAIHQSDGGSWLGKAVAQCAPYVVASVALLVPELAQRDGPAATSRDEWTGQRLFSALETTLRALSEVHRLGLLIEDLHWADTATLDLVEHLAARAPDVAMLGTWRADDPAISPTNLTWFNRIRRTTSVRTLPLAALSRAETIDQLALLTGHTPAATIVDAIHFRTQGQPLFTEQLAADAGRDRPLPALLADLLDARLGDLTGPAWVVARALGTADRPLTAALLTRITGLAADDLTAGLHDLDGRRLLAPSRDEVTLRHPLLAEAIRRRLVVGEAEGVHASVASALGVTTDPEPAEVARHWQSAGNHEQELHWRIRAARSAHSRYAVQQEADNWVRALELWPGDAPVAGDPPVRRFEALVAVMSIYGGVDPERAVLLTADALMLVPELPPLEAAQLLHLAGDHLANGQVVPSETQHGLDLLHRAIAIYEEVAPVEDHVRTLTTLEAALTWDGRVAEAAAAVARGLAVSAELEDPGWFRRLLVRQAWYDVRKGDVATGMTRLREAIEVVVAGPDPEGEAELAIYHTDLLLLTAGDVDEVVAAGQRGLEATAVWDRETYLERAILFNMSLSARRAGQILRATAFIAPHTTQDPVEGQWRLHLERACLELCQGHEEQAAALIGVLSSVPVIALVERMDVAECLVGVALWLGRHEEAYERLVPLIREASQTEAADDLRALLTLAVRAAADGPARLRRARRDDLAALHEACVLDPFAIRLVPADGQAWTATWTAELDRLTGTASVERWVVAASEWDKLTRPHDAAYCRWRAAQVAISTGQGTVAARLLRRAATDAREHVPLNRAIAATVAGVH